MTRNSIEVSMYHVAYKNCLLYPRAFWKPVLGHVL
uniref:Uncharacterized protein n=1 Tax=Rhizophora mucronata TaxID=61149 RepID=A0A2P2PVJ9_RHIMU